ncbi:MAG: hypothetical protein FD189_1070 [Elusimicrobia bacterium]|nr:MAG: hypothetical protein FD189_1070 [Elusimicrobiota bacterium]
MKIHDRIKTAFPGKCDAAFHRQFGIQSETSYNIIALQMVTTLRSGKRMTARQKEWLGAYSDGYGEALDQICE